MKIRTVTFESSQKSFEVPEQVLLQSSYFKRKMEKLAPNEAITIKQTEKGYTADCEELFPDIIEALRDGIAYITEDTAKIIKSAALFYKLGDDVNKMCDYFTNQPKDITAAIIQEKTNQIVKLQIDANDINKKFAQQLELNQIGQTINDQLENEVSTLQTTVSKLEKEKNDLEIEITPLRKNWDELEFEKCKVTALNKQVERLQTVHMLNFDVIQAEGILAQGKNYSLQRVGKSFRSALNNSIAKFNFYLEMPETKVLEIIGFRIDLPIRFFVEKIEIYNEVISTQLDFVRFSQQEIYLLNKEPLMANIPYELKVHFVENPNASKTTAVKKPATPRTTPTKATPTKATTTNDATAQPKWTIYKPEIKPLFRDVMLKPIESVCGGGNTIIYEITFDVAESIKPTAKKEQEDEEMVTGEASEALEESDSTLPRDTSSSQQ